jgi:hypothetical protein
VLRPTPLVWIFVVVLLLIPSPAGRALLDVVGGVVVVLLALPLILGGLGWLGWTLLQRRMVACPSCGAMSFSPGEPCRFCGAELSGPEPVESESAPASAMTVDVRAEDVEG